MLCTGLALSLSIACLHQTNLSDLAVQLSTLPETAQRRENNLSPHWGRPRGQPAPVNAARAPPPIMYAFGYTAGSLVSACERFHWSLSLQIESMSSTVVATKVGYTPSPTSALCNFCIGTGVQDLVPRSCDLVCGIKSLSQPETVSFSLPLPWRRSILVAASRLSSKEKASLRLSQTQSVIAQY